MNKNELKRYRTDLAAMKDRLTGDVAQMIQTVESDARATLERDRRLNEAPDKELALEIGEERLLREVTDALDRIEAGTYGNCRQCAGPIAKPRLDAIPYTPFCIACERLIEAGAP